MIKRISKKLFKHSQIVGYKFHYAGRYTKKLRNMPSTTAKGCLALSIRNIPLNYYQCSILTKQGLIGLKVWLLKKKYFNEII